MSTTTRQTAAPIKHHSLGASNRSAREVARLLIETTWWTLDAPYQRGSGVWTYDQRLGLVRSWLTGIPVPAILVNDRTTAAWRDANGGVNPNDTGHDMYAVVDGKQRVETAVAWFSGDLAAPASWFAPDAVETTLDTDDGPYVTYTGLTPAGQRHMANRAMLPVIEASVASVAEEAEMFLLINGGGTPQTAADMLRAAAHTKG